MLSLTQGEAEERARLLHVDRYEVVGTDQARRASDHLPVLADLALPSS